MRRPALLAAVLALVAAAPAAAAKARFAVTVEGVQSTTWSYEHTGLGGCDLSFSSSGTESVRFRSKPVAVSASVLPGMSAPVLTAPGRPALPVARLRGTVTRAAERQGPTGGECGGDGGEVVPPDCGTKAFAAPIAVELSYRSVRRPKDHLTLEPEVGGDPFANCDSGAFPRLITTQAGAPMRAELPRDELFDPEIGKLIVIARGEEVDAGPEYRSRTTSRWVITFVRKR